ncbi:hypothetical protein DFH27DRAFT_571993 [Peziza echinospora]|nr:hypothetical protein DFH27DRAFT_571993 [Peziza echinospora]
MYFFKMSGWLTSWCLCFTMGLEGYWYSGWMYSSGSSGMMMYSVAMTCAITAFGATTARPFMLTNVFWREPK